MLRLCFRLTLNHPSLLFSSGGTCKLNHVPVALVALARLELLGVKCAYLLYSNHHSLWTAKVQAHVSCTQHGCSVHAAPVGVMH